MHPSQRAHRMTCLLLITKLHCRNGFTNAPVAKNSGALHGAPQSLVFRQPKRTRSKR